MAGRLPLASLLLVALSVRNLCFRMNERRPAWIWSRGAVYTLRQLHLVCRGSMGGVALWIT